MESNRAEGPTRGRWQLERWQRQMATAARQQRNGRLPRAELHVPPRKWKLGRHIVQKRQSTRVPNLL